MTRIEALPSEIDRISKGQSILLKVDDIPSEDCIVLIDRNGVDVASCEIVSRIPCNYIKVRLQSDVQNKA